MTDLTNAIYHDENAAREHLENLRWPDGPVCAHCGVLGMAGKVQGKSHRPGLYYCNGCKKQYTVTIGTVFEDSKIKLHKWVLAYHLMCASKKGMSAHQLHRMLGVTYKTAWFMAHRIRESMREPLPEGGLGGANKVVEVDETYVGGKAKNRKSTAPIPRKEPVVSLVERDGRVRSFHLPNVTAKTLRPVLVAHIDRKSYLMTDESMVYIKTGEEFGGHGTVNHSIEEYVRGAFFHTNTVEGYFSILKRGIIGVYHHVSQQHLKRYVGEFDFRYNNRKIDDATRADIALTGAAGKRLTYKPAN